MGVIGMAVYVMSFYDSVLFGVLLAYSLHPQTFAVYLPFCLYFSHTLSFLIHLHQRQQTNCAVPQPPRFQVYVLQTFFTKTGRRYKV